jgi:hypothetical protein
MSPDLIDDQVADPEGDDGTSKDLRPERIARKVSE